MILRKWLALAACLLLTQGVPAAYGAGDHDDFYEMKNRGGAFIAALESLPYVSEGTGPVMFTLEYSECPYCQGMYRDYKAAATGLEFRRVFVPVSDRSAREAAAMGKSRSIQDYHAFMTGRKQAPVFNRDNAAINAFNAIIKGTDEIEVILKQNGWPRQGLVFPQFAWVENGKVFTSAGYEKSDFGKAVARAKSGGGTADVWTHLAGGKTTAPAKAGPAQASSAPRKSTGLDIIGIEIGMTKEEVLAVLKAYDPRMQIGEQAVKIVVPDSNRQMFEAGSFLKGMWAGHSHGSNGFNSAQDPTEKIVIYFSPPPAEHRVEFVGREVTYPTGKGPDFEIAMQSIAQKYGKPMHVDDTRKGAGERGTVTQFWQEKGAPLKGQQYVKWSNRSGIMAPLNYKAGQYFSAGGQRPPVSNNVTGQNLGIMVNKQGNVAFMMRFMLADDIQLIEQRHAATWDLGQAALQQHEQKLRGAAQQRQGPRL